MFPWKCLCLKRDHLVHIFLSTYLLTLLRQGRVHLRKPPLKGKYKETSSFKAYFFKRIKYKNIIKNAIPLLDTLIHLYTLLKSFNIFIILKVLN
jgi:hypothetical protein